MASQQAGRAGTRKAIVEAGLKGFGEKGFAATTTREIAALAGTNVASISYHFGGKEGLREACAEHIVAVLREVLPGPEATLPQALAPDAARQLLLRFATAMVEFVLLRPDARLVAGFMLREMAQPSRALDIVYAGLFEGVHRRVCGLWAAATGCEAESEAVKLAVFAVIGQILYFHIGRPVVMRRLGWAAIGPDEVRAIVDAVSRTVTARLEADRDGKP